MKKDYQLIARCCDGSCTNEELEYLYEHDREIKAETFFRHVSLQMISEYFDCAFGHQKGLHIKKDWAIRFYRSRFRGLPCYHIDWSAIDHIYLDMSLDIRWK